jgi:hypothetical protein
MGRREGKYPRPAQRVSKREERNQRTDIKPRTGMRLPRLVTYHSHDNSPDLASRADIRAELAYTERGESPPDQAKSPWMTS